MPGSTVVYVCSICLKSPVLYFVSVWFYGQVFTEHGLKSINFDFNTSFIFVTMNHSTGSVQHEIHHKHVKLYWQVSVSTLSYSLLLPSWWFRIRGWSLTFLSCYSRVEWMWVRYIRAHSAAVSGELVHPYGSSQNLSKVYEKSWYLQVSVHYCCLTALPVDVPKHEVAIRLWPIFPMETLNWTNLIKIPIICEAMTLKLAKW